MKLFSTIVSEISSKKCRFRKHKMLGFGYHKIKKRMRMITLAGRQIVRLVFLWLLSLCLTGLHGAAYADEQADFARLSEIQILADKDNAQGLKQIEVFKQSLSPQASEALRLETFKVLIGLYIDAGEIKAADATLAEYLKFAEASHNEAAIALAKIADAQRIQFEGKTAVALKLLGELEAKYKNSDNPEVKMRLNAALGGIYSTTGKFELALNYQLEALRQAEFQVRRKEIAKINRLGAISALYLNMKDPQKALDTTKDALVVAPNLVTPKILTTLLTNQGVAYAQLGKYSEARLSFEKLLGVAIDAKIPSAEAIALVNLSDHYLLMREYGKAETFARRALEKAEPINDKDSVAVGKANLGFALGGQGKISQAVPYVKEVIDYYKKTGSKADVEAITGELASMYENAGMFKEALATVRAQQAISDELFTTERSKAVSSLQEQFNAEQRQKQIELLAKENDLKDSELHNRRLQQIVAMLGVLLAVLGGAVIFMLYRKANKANLELKEVNTKLEFFAVRDPLTGLYNRRSFVDMMRNRVVVAEADRRQEGVDNPDCMILLDIDEFKHINDTYGHAVGDVVLTEVARRLKSSVRDTDMVLRWGGEEFLIFSPKANTAQITRLVERVLRAIGESRFHIGELDVPVTVTAGFISLPFSGISEEVCDWEKTLQIADMALFLGKAHGRNRAYGIGRLLVDKEDALPLLESNVGAAIEAKMVEVIELLGPPQKKESKPEAAH